MEKENPVTQAKKFTLDEIGSSPLKQAKYVSPRVKIFQSVDLIGEGEDIKWFFGHILLADRPPH